MYGYARTDEGKLMGYPTLWVEEIKSEYMAEKEGAAKLRRLWPKYGTLPLVLCIRLKNGEWRREAIEGRAQ